METSPFNNVIHFHTIMIQRIIPKKHVFALTNRGIVPIYNSENLFNFKDMLYVILFII